MPRLHHGHERVRTVALENDAWTYAGLSAALVDEIPLGPTGKIDKKLLRTRLTGYALPFDAAVRR